MAIYLVKSQSTRYFIPEAKYWQRDVVVDLVEVTSGVEFSPTRAAFIASDDDLGEIAEFTLLYADDTAEILNLPRAGEKDGKHYYSCHWKMLKSVDTGGNQGPVPTPTPTPTTTPEPTPNPCILYVRFKFNSGWEVGVSHTVSHQVENNQPVRLSNGEEWSAYYLQSFNTMLTGNVFRILAITPSDATSSSAYDFEILAKNGTWVPVDVDSSSLIIHASDDGVYYPYTYDLPLPSNLDFVCEDIPPPTPTPTNNVEEPIDDYIYDSMEAVSIIGTTNGTSGSAAGLNDRNLVSIQGVNGVTGLSLENDVVTLTEAGRYYIKARSGSYAAGLTSTNIYFISGDYADTSFEGPKRFCDTNSPDVKTTESSVVVDITQTTKLKIQTFITSAKSGNGLLNGGASTLFVQKLANADGGSSSSNGSSGNGSAISNTTHFKNTIVTTQNIPDALVVDCDGIKVCFTLEQGSETDLTWSMNGTAGNLDIRFTNVADPVFSRCQYPDHDISSGSKLFDLISDGTIEAVYYGGTSSSSNDSGSSNNSSTSSVLGVGIGNLDYIKTLYGTGVSDSGVDDIKLRFSEEIPDAIVAKDGDGGGAYWDLVLRLTDIGISEGGLQAWYVRNNYYIYFDLNTTNGDYIDDLSIDDDEFKTNASLKDYVDEGRALYYGGSSSSDSSSSNGSSSSGGISAWGVFDGTSNYDADNYLPITASENIESIKYIKTGVYDVTLTTPMPNEHYSVSVNCNPSGYGGAFGGVMEVYMSNTYDGSLDGPSASKFRIDVRTAANANTNSNRITFHVVGGVSTASGGFSLSEDTPDENIGISDYTQYSLTTLTDSVAQTKSEPDVDIGDDYRYYSL